MGGLVDVFFFLNFFQNYKIISPPTSDPKSNANSRTRICDRIRCGNQRPPNHPHRCGCWWWWCRICKNGLSDVSLNWCWPHTRSFRRTHRRRTIYQNRRAKGGAADRGWLVRRRNRYPISMRFDAIWSIAYSCRPHRRRRFSANCYISNRAGLGSFFQN